ncbi:hypothetical protein Leryth_008135 [Lithospermum erythrorhizon]|nr:hypothetical protein Leryth_008135 [Lithospermum erythrorhizon]
MTTKLGKSIASQFRPKLASALDSLRSRAIVIELRYTRASNPTPIDHLIPNLFKTFLQIQKLFWNKLKVQMFKNTFQSGFLSILYSLGSKPLQIWDKEVEDGHVKRLQDDDIQSNVLEINVKKFFTFEIQVLDDKNVRRRFRPSNYQAVTRVKPYICTMPLRLDEGWNQIQLNLSDLTRRAYGTNYAETLRVQVHANCRLRRIYFSDRLYSEEELPPEFKLYLPMQKA